MAPLKTTDVKHEREDLADTINDLTPSDTVFYSAIQKTSATATYHEYLSDALASPNKDNASAEGADAGPADQTGPARFGNYTQIFTKTVDISGTLDAVKTAGTKSELARQLVKKGAELKRDINAAFLSANSSVATGTRKLAGASAWIKTNANHGTGGSTAGFNPVTGTVGAVVAGTDEVLTEADFKTTISDIWQNSDGKITVFVNSALRPTISGFAGNATKYQNFEKGTIYATANFYESDFGMITVVNERQADPKTVYFIDESLWAAATLRKFQKNELGKVGDATRYQLLTEITLECRNEAGNGKLADRIA